MPANVLCRKKGCFLAEKPWNGPFQAGWAGAQCNFFMCGGDGGAEYTSVLCHTEGFIQRIAVSGKHNLAGGTILRSLRAALIDYACSRGWYSTSCHTYTCDKNSNIYLHLPERRITLINRLQFFRVPSLPSSSFIPLYFSKCICEPAKLI